MNFRDWNYFVLPAPKFNYDTLNNFRNNIVFIPIENSEEYIPCLLLRSNKEENTNNFVIMFHGNAEDIFNSWELADGICKKFKMNVLIVEYPGYSLYEANKSCDKMLKNSLIVYDYLKENFGNVKDENIFVFGRSIGSGPAIYLASERKPASLFVVSGFTSLREVVGSMFGWFNYFKGIVNNIFPSIDYINKVFCPIYFVHGKKDTLIPYTETQKLIEKCGITENEAKYPEHMTHNDYCLEEDILNPILDFIEKKQLRKLGQTTTIRETLFKLPQVVEEELKISKQNNLTVYKRNSLVDW